MALFNINHDEQQQPVATILDKPFPDIFSGLGTCLPVNAIPRQPGYRGHQVLLLS